MTMLVNYIDAIARKKGRDVVFATFQDCEEWYLEGSIDYEDSPARKVVIGWLDEHGISWTPCAGFASENSFGPYTGGIYIDVPYDEEDESYRRVQAFLENPDGASRIAGVGFWYLPLAMAMENRHHDEPGFWDKWVDDL